MSNIIEIKKSIIIKYEEREKRLPEKLKEKIETTIKYNNIKNHAYYYKVGSDEDAVRTMCVAYKKGKYISKACRKFINTLKEELE